MPHGTPTNAFSARRASRLLPVSAAVDLARWIHAVVESKDAAEAFHGSLHPSKKRLFFGFLWNGAKVVGTRVP